MSRDKLILLLSSLLLLTIPFANAHAANRKGAFTFSTMVNKTYFASPRNYTDPLSPMFGLGYDFNKHFGVEATFNVINTDTRNVTPKRSVTGNYYSLNGLFFFNALMNNHVQPYLSGGFGVSRLNPNGTITLDQPDGDESTAQANGNIGAGLEVFLANWVALRGEVRDVYTFARGLNDVQLNGGLTFVFGGTA